MTKQLRNIIITVCIFIVLGGVLLLIKFLPTGKSSSSSSDVSTSSSVTLDNIASSKVVSVHVSNTLGQYTILKSGSAWVVNELKTYPLSQSNISNIVVDVSTISALQTVMQSSSGPGLAQYGLSPAKATAELTTTDGKTITLLVGKEAPTNIGYYAMMKGDSKVYLVSTTLGADLTAAPQSLIDLNLVTLDQNKLGTLSQLTFAGTGRQQPIKLTVDPTSASSFVASTDQNGNIDTPSYNIISPGSYVTNYENISTMLNNMLTLNASDIASLDVSDKSLSSFGLKNPAYTLSYTYNKESYTLSFGNTFTKTTDNAQYVYVTITGKNLIYDIAVSSVPFYNWSLSDVGPSTVYESPLVDDVKSFTIASPSSSWTFNLSGSLSDLKVLYGSKTLNTDQFMNLYEQDFFMPPQGTGTMPGNTQVLLTETLNYKDTSKKPDVIKFYTVPDSKDPTKADSFKVFCTVNGVGNFYVKRSLVDSILQYTQDYVNGKDVPSE